MSSTENGKTDKQNEFVLKKRETVNRFEHVSPMFTVK